MTQHELATAVDDDIGDGRQGHRRACASATPQTTRVTGRRIVMNTLFGSST